MGVTSIIDMTQANEDWNNELTYVSTQSSTKRPPCPRPSTGMSLLLMRSDTRRMRKKSSDSAGRDNCLSTPTRSSPSPRGVKRRLTLTNAELQDQWSDRLSFLCDEHYAPGPSCTKAQHFLSRTTQLMKS